MGSTAIEGTRVWPKTTIIVCMVLLLVLRLLALPVGRLLLPNVTRAHDTIQAKRKYPQEQSEPQKQSTAVKAVWTQKRRCQGGVVSSTCMCDCQGGNANPSRSNHSDDQHTSGIVVVHSQKTETVESKEKS